MPRKAAHILPHFCRVRENSYRQMTSGEAGLGAAICIDGMIPQEFADRVVFRPFAPALVSDVYLAWRKNAALSPAAAALVAAVRDGVDGD